MVSIVPTVQRRLRREPQLKMLATVYQKQIKLKIWWKAVTTECWRFYSLQTESSLKCRCNWGFKRMLRKTR